MAALALRSFISSGQVAFQSLRGKIGDRAVDIVIEVYVVKLVGDHHVAVGHGIRLGIRLRQRIAIHLFRVTADFFALGGRGYC